MFELETGTLIQAITQRIPQSAGDAIALKDILAADIPMPIKSYFRADVEAMLFSELHRYRKGSRFNFEHPELRSLQDQINSILVLNYTFSKNEFLSRVDDTVHMIINYLVRPQWTLVNMIFEKEPNISTQSLIVLLRHLGPYEYIREIISQYLTEKKIATISKEEFKLLLWKVDGGYIGRKTGDELSKILSPLFDFFDFPKKTGTNPILIKALIKYFEDKGLMMVIPRLEGEIAQGKLEISRHELSALLEDFRRTLGSFKFEKVEIEQKELIEPSTDGDQSAPTRILNIESSIDESDKKKFIRKIFKHTEKDFNSAIQSIGNLNSWKQASKFIDEIFIKNDVDPYSAEATKFIEIIYEQYHPKNK